MSRASNQLMESKDHEERALAAYIFGLIDKASASGHGYSKRKRAKMCNVYRTDSKVLNQFQIDAADIEHVLIARANH